jgi:hypothetical protein
MQPVGRNERLEWHVVDFVPMPHESEAVKQVDILLLGGGRNQVERVR